MSWPLVSFGLMNSVFFGTYGHMLQTIGHDIHDTTQTHLLQIFGVGLLATAPTVFFACPIDVVKVTLQSQIKHDVCPTTGTVSLHICSNTFYRNVVIIPYL